MPHVAIYAVISSLQAHTGFHIVDSAWLIAWPYPEAKLIQPDRPEYGASIGVVFKGG